MSQARIFITRRITAEAMRLMESVAEVVVWQGEDPPSYARLCEEASHSDGLLTMLTDRIDKALIEASPLLKVISQMAVGYDNIDLDAAKAHQIKVGHTPGVLTETTADLAWALLMATARRIVESDAEVRQGIWRAWGPFVLCGQDIHGATLGIIGMGRIGQAMARRANGFGMRILYHDLRPERAIESQTGAVFTPLNDLLTQSDFISLHTYLSPETFHMISAPQFDLMKPTAIIINTSRGAVVDSTALLDALTNGKIAAAGLDVFDPEPIPLDHPILKLKNVVVTPHIASASIHTRSIMAMMSAENIVAGLSGLPLPYSVPGM